MLSHVIKGIRDSENISKLYVATDHEKIKKVALEEGIEVILTDTVINSGTERIIAASREIEIEWEMLINVQGDEPLIKEKHLDALIELAETVDCDVVTLARPLESIENAQSPNIVKVIFDREKMAHYFSRALIPYPRNKTEVWYQHIGIYGFRNGALDKIKNFPPSPLEKSEGLEQLRWLDNGMKIAVAITDSPLIGVDVPDDITVVEAILKKEGNS